MKFYFRRLIDVFIGFVVAPFLLSTAMPVGQTRVVSLKCEYLENPLGIDMQNPRFFWQIESQGKGERQKAYRLLVASSEENLNNNTGDIYDSRKVLSGENTQIEYKGKTLYPACTYYWKVMIWDKDGKPTAWSEPASFGTGLFSGKNWKGARWIAWRPQKEWETEWWRKKDIETKCLEFGVPCWFGQRFTLWELYYFHADNPYDSSPLFRKEFYAGKKITDAKIFISGLGYYELYINGERAGDRYLNPGWTNYNKTVLYDVQDVTGLLKEGENVIGVMLGRGNYGSMAVDHWGFYKKGGYIGQPKLLCRLHIRYEDGTESDVVSDDSWKVTGGPIIFDDPRMGEIYDAEKEVPGWSEPGINTDRWDHVNLAPAPAGQLKAQLCQPIRITRVFKPAKLEKRPQGYWIDAGTNLAGWLRVRFNGKPGERVLIFYGEKEEAKTLNQPANFQQMAYILKGEPGETAMCHFSYKGFRYALVTGYTGEISVNDVDVCQVNSDVPSAGSFECSDSVINGIHRICRKAMISNLHSIPTDCPHREKNGWLGDAVTGMEFGMANYDLAALMTKFTRDIFDTQDEEGRLATIAPDNNYYKGRSPLWSSAAVYIPWYMWTYYGDKRLFEEYWEPMKKWVASVWKYDELKDTPGLFTDVLSDWNPPTIGNAPEGGEVYSSMNFFLVLKRLESMALVLNKKDDAKAFARQAEIVKKAINTYCFDSKTMAYHGLHSSEYRQGPNTMALYCGIVPQGYCRKVEEDLYKSLVNTYNYHVYGGVFTVHSIYELLPQLDEAELAYKLASNDSYPSFGYMVKNGATTLWEDWSGQGSHIHHFFGSVDNFFYRYIAGINVNPDGTGFRNIRITPCFIKGIDHASAAYHSLQGFISSGWKKTGEGHYILDLQIPANCEASVEVPATISEAILDGATIWKDGKALGKIKTRKQNGHLIIPVNSGTYRLSISLVRQ